MEISMNNNSPDQDISTNLNMQADIVIVGCGVAGLYAALNLPRNRKILIITKSDAKNSDSFLAQGGMCVLKDDDDYDSYFEDTMQAGHYENNKESVDIMIRSSREVAKDLIQYGVNFDRDENGRLAFTKEGAHSTSRILFHKDITGKEITSTLLAQVRLLPNVTLLEGVTMLDIFETKNTCYGVICRINNKEQKFLTIQSRFTVWACGGIGGLYKHSSNFRHLTGDALAISLRHNIKLQNIDYIQIHPTTLYSKKPGRRFLISESVRGEGALLYNSNGDRFVNELFPRDVVANAIYKQMELYHKPYVWLSMAPIEKSVIIKHFPNIYNYCLQEGYDVTKEPIPVVPAQHYFMGGVDVNSQSQTSMKQLYAVGETSCNGVHGANRLASNSLLESMVFAKRAAKDIVDKWDGKTDTLANQTALKYIDLSAYKNYDNLQYENKKLIFDEIERMKKTHEQHINEAKCR
jgi:L-aspartate oxidase